MRNTLYYTPPFLAGSKFLWPRWSIHNRRLRRWNLFHLGPTHHEYSPSNVGRHINRKLRTTPPNLLPFSNQWNRRRRQTMDTPTRSINLFFFNFFRSFECLFSRMVLKTSASLQTQRRLLKQTNSASRWTRSKRCSPIWGTGCGAAPCSRYRRYRRVDPASLTKTKQKQKTKTKNKKQKTVVFKYRLELLVSLHLNKIGM